MLNTWEKVHHLKLIWSGLGPLEKDFINTPFIPFYVAPFLFGMSQEECHLVNNLAFNFF